MKRTRHFAVSLLMIICLLQLQILPHLVYAEDQPDAGGEAIISAEEIPEEAEAEPDSVEEVEEEPQEEPAEDEEAIILAQEEADPDTESIEPDQEEASEEELAGTGLFVTWATDSVVVGVGESIDLEIGTMGTGLSYQWQWAPSEDGLYTNCSSAGATSKHFSFTAKKAFSGRFYRCLVKNDKGQVDECAPIQITVYDIYIKKAPNGLDLPLGGQGSFTVTAQGLGLSYQWQWSSDTGSTWNNCKGSGYNTDTFSFKASSAIFGRYYRCFITDKYGNEKFTNSCPVREIPQGTFEILSHPNNVAASPGYYCYFNCYARGDGLTYQWQWSTSKNGKYTNATSFGANTATFSFRVKGSYNGRFYRCLVTDRSGKTLTSQPGELYVYLNYGPGISRHPEVQSLFDGEEAVFSVTAEGSGLKYQWQWSKSMDGAYTDNTSKGYNSSTFRFKTNMGLDGRYYRCRVTDSAGNVKYSIPAGLYVFPMTVYIISHPQDQSVEDGTRVEFYVDAKGKGLKYQWQWSTSSSGPWTDNTSTGYDLDAFSFNTKIAFNGRYYRCKITDGYGNIQYTRAAKLEVRQIPLAIIKDPEYRGVGIGEKVTFYIVARGKNVTYQWQWSDGNGSWNNCSSTGYNTDSFSFTSKMAFNGRLYRCRVKDAYGNVAYSSYARLAVYGGVG